MLQIDIDPAERIATLTLDRPEKRNALSLELMERLTCALEDIGRNTEVAVVILSANGSVFSAGHDLAELVDRSAREYQQIFDQCVDMITAVQRIPQPVIAQVRGVATAAGCQLVATCDLAFADEGASFGTPGVRIGLFCSTPMVAVSRAIGRKRALQLLLTGERIDARTAAEWGLINAAVPAAELEDQVRLVARQIVRASPLIVGIGKRAFYAQIEMDQHAAYQHTGDVMTMNALMADAHEGITAFLDKREPHWAGAQRLMALTETQRARKFWGWGYEGEGLSDAEVDDIGREMQSRFGVEPRPAAASPALASLDMRAPRLAPPQSLAALCSQDQRERAVHTLGKSYSDLVRGMRGDYRYAPDVVAYPRDEQEVENVLAWCAEQKAAAIPFGGGSSVVRGIEADVGDGYAAAVSIDLRHLNQVLEVDRASRSALIQAGVLGPYLEEQLKPHGLTLRHFPQSFEMSTLGGWIATRSGGHYATLFTHIDEFVEGVRAITPRGAYETRRLPGSGAGPDPARLLIGSEGTLGVITRAWMRLQDRPRYRASAPFEFERFEAACDAARAIAQSGLWPANCRLLDHREALFSAAGDGTRSLLIVTFESGDHALDAWFARAAELCSSFGGSSPVELSGTSTAGDAAHRGAAGAWRNAFIAGGHRHDAFVRLGLVMETFETAITWDRFPSFHAAVVAATEAAAARVCGRAMVSCRFAYVYPDGPAPYYTVLGQGRPGSELEQWAEVKSAASEAIIAGGGTITHHHAVGRDHRPWYDQERPPLFAEAYRAARRVLDPAGIMNPGVLVDP